VNFLGSFQRIPEKNQKVHHETPPVGKKGCEKIVLYVVDVT